MKKRTIAILFALCVLSLAACGKNDTNGDNIVGNDPVVDNNDNNIANDTHNDDKLGDDILNDNNATDNATGGTDAGIGTQSGRAVRDAADGVGNAIEDVGRGADNVMHDVGNGISNMMNR